MTPPKEDMRKSLTPQVRYGIFGPESRVYPTESVKKVTAKLSTKWSPAEMQRARAMAIKPKAKSSQPVWNKNMVQKPKREMSVVEKPSKPTKSKVSKVGRTTKSQRVTIITGRNFGGGEREASDEEAGNRPATEKKKRLGKKKTKKGKKKKQVANEDETSGSESESSDRLSQKELEGQLDGLQDVVMELVRQYPRILLQAKMIVNKNPVLRNLPLMLKLKSIPAADGEPAAVLAPSKHQEPQHQSGEKAGVEPKLSQGTRLQSYMYGRNEATLKKLYGES